MAENKPYMGYNFCGVIHGNLIPQKVQNSFIRDYAQINKIPLTFSESEYINSSQSLMLFFQLQHLNRISGFIFYSLHLLPSDSEKRNEFYTKILDAKKTVHFALEDLILSTNEDTKYIERIYIISRDPRFHRTRKILSQLI